MKSSVGAVGVVLLCGGCFVDAVGLAGGGEGGSSPTTATGGDATSSQTTTSTMGSMSASTTTTTATGMGGEGGMGGGPCPDSVLVLDDSDSASVTSANFDIDDTFAAGAWIFPTQDPAFIPGDTIQTISIFLSHGDLAAGQGFLLGLQDTMDTGQPYVGIVTYPLGQACLALAPIAWDQWVHVAGVYDDDIIGDDLSIYVNGAFAGSVNCSAPPPVTSYSGPFVVGARADTMADAFLGFMDDVFVKHGTSLPDITMPVSCGAEYVAAFTFDTGMASSCADALTLVPSPAPTDPEIGCMP
ncbi:MAG: LamG domain-containing protein [Polyangiaceae bacterium]|nr:LamG domain-containing protein [Polyangiaceae bacterium]